MNIRVSKKRKAERQQASGDGECSGIISIPLTVMRAHVCTCICNDYSIISVTVAINLVKYSRKIFL